MKIVGAGTSPKTIAAECLSNQLRYGDNPRTDSLYLIESDRGKSVRFASPLSQFLINVDDSVALLECPFQELSARFAEGQILHLDFVPREALESPLSSGMENMRGVGNQAALWYRSNLRTQLARLISEGKTEPSDNASLVVLAHSAGGTGSSLAASLPEVLQAIRGGSGGNLRFATNFILTFQPAADFEAQNTRLLCNEAATAMELGSLLAGGACFPNASRSDWGKPQSFSLNLRAAFVHDPGDRGLDPVRLISTVAKGTDLLFSDPLFSPRFHADADDQHSKAYFDDTIPGIWSFGVSSICTLDFERTLHHRSRLAAEGLRACLEIQGNPERFARQLLQRNGLTENGRSTGLSAMIRGAAFDGKDPIRDKILSRPSHTASVGDRIAKIRSHNDLVERQIGSLLGQYEETVDALTPNLLDRCQELVLDCFRSVTPAKAVRVLRQLPAILDEKQSELRTSLQKALARKEQAADRETAIYKDAKEHAGLPLIGRVTDFFAQHSRPGVYQQIQQRKLVATAQAEILRFTEKAQSRVRNYFLEFAERLGDLERSLFGALRHYDNKLAALVAGGALHRGQATCLSDPEEFDTAFENSGLAVKEVRSVAHQLRSFIQDSFNRKMQPPTQEEVTRFLDGVIERVAPFQESDVGESLSQRKDASRLLRTNIGRSAPLLAVDETQYQRTEAFFVLVHGAEQNLHASEIRRVSTMEGCSEPRFVNWPYRNEIVFLRAWFGIPLSAVCPLQRSEKVYRESSKEDRMASHRMPILWFLPTVTRTPAQVETLRFALMAGIAGLLKNEGSRWVFESKSGTHHDLGDLSFEKVHDFFSNYRNAAESSSWFICETLVRGFPWAMEKLLEIVGLETFRRGQWPKAIKEFSKDLELTAKKHHQTILPRKS